MSARTKTNLEVLETLVTIIMGLALGDILIQFIETFGLNKGALIWAVPLGATMLLVALLVIVTRFYHGNMRIIREVHDTPGASSVTLGQVADWGVILAQGALFIVVGHFHANPVNLNWVVLAVLTIDVLWLLVAVARQGEASAARSAARVWAALNGITFIALIVIQILYIQGVLGVDWSRILFASCLIVASVFDYWLQYRFYFPASVVGGRNVFVAGAFTSAIGANGVVSQELRVLIEGVIHAVKAKGCKYFSAHEREKWGERLGVPAEIWQVDVAAMRRATDVIAVLGTVNSPGTLVEIGIAAASGKRTLVLTQDGLADQSAFLQGMRDCEVIHVARIKGAADVADAVGEWFTQNDRYGASADGDVAVGTA